MEFIKVVWGCVLIVFFVYLFIDTMGLKNPSRVLARMERKRNAKQRIERIRLGLEPCSRCGGSGYLPQFDHVENGICFLCRGYTKYGRYDSVEAAKRRHEEAVKARNEPPVPRPKYLEKRARYYELLSIYHLQCIMEKNSKEIEDDEIAVIERTLENKLEVAQDPSNSKEQS